MLPFSKRPKTDEPFANDGDEVFTKESLSASRPPSPRLPRPMAQSVTDEEMTTLMPSKGLPAPMAARVPSVVPPPARSSRSVAPPPVASTRSVAPPPVASTRSVAPPAPRTFDDEMATEVRSAGPKVVKRASKGGPPRSVAPSPTSAPPPSMFPKHDASLSHGNANRGRTGVMAGPPPELLEDLVDRQGEALALGRTGGGPAAALGTLPHAMPVQAHPRSAHVAPSLPPSHGSGAYPFPAPPPSYPRSSYTPPPPASFAPAPMSSGGRVPGVPASMPPHFMVPQAPYSDPPGTALSTRAKAGRPTSTWAMGLLAFGLLVGVSAVALTQTHADGILETTASFVDPSRAASPSRAAAASPASEAVAVPVPVQPVAEAPKVAVPVTPPAPPVAAPPVVAPVAAPAVAPVVAAVAEPVAPAPKPVAVAAPPPAPKPVAVAAPAPRPVQVAAPAPRPAPKPVAVASASDDEPAPAKKPAKSSKGGKSDLDEETRKALEALQKSQLESSF